MKCVYCNGGGLPKLQDYFPVEKNRRFITWTCRSCGKHLFSREYNFEEISDLGYPHLTDSIEELDSKKPGKFLDWEGKLKTFDGKLF